MDSMIWSLVRFLNGENQNYGVTIQQRMIQGDYFIFFLFLFFKCFEFRTKQKYYKGGERKGRISDPP